MKINKSTPGVFRWMKRFYQIKRGRFMDIDIYTAASDRLDMGTCDHCGKRMSEPPTLGINYEYVHPECLGQHTQEIRQHQQERRMDEQKDWGSRL